MKKIIGIILGLNLIFAFAGSASAATISGTKFNDVNGNGVMDVGETGLPGVVIYIDQNSSATLDAGDISAVTDANGTFSFPGLADGSYTVREVAVTGWTQILPGAGANLQHVINVTGGVNVGAINFGNQLSVAATLPGTVSGTKFNDLDGDGVLDAGEPGLSGIMIFLDVNGNNSLDSGELSTTTNASGNYSFAGVAPGSFAVREGVTAGWTQTFPGVSADLEHSLSLVSGGALTGINFGNQFTSTSTGVISGVKYNDLNADGIRDAGEPGIGGVKVYLDTDNDTFWDADEAMTTTDASGNYRFVGLAAGTYTVREQGTAGWTQTYPSLGASFRHSVNLALGATVSGIDFANYRLGTYDDSWTVADPVAGGPGEVLGDAVGGDSLPVTGITLPLLLTMLLAFGVLGYNSLVHRGVAAKATKK